MQKSIYDETIQNMFSNKDYTDEYVFYACLLSKCNVYFSDTLESPAGVSFTDNYNLYINLKLFSEYSLENRMAILKHEMLHILNGHLLHRNENKQHKNWNLATDCAINQLIDKNHLPQNCITTEYIEELIKKPVKKLEPSEYYYNLLENSNIDTSKIDKNIDEHPTWELNDSQISEDAQKQITTEIIEETMQESMSIIGNYPNKCSTWLEINKRKTKINWKALLKSYLRSSNYKRTIFRRNRRNPDRKDLKGKINLKEASILYIIDASGSVQNSAFKKLNSEILSLCSELNIEITAIQVDTEASEPEKLSKNTKMIQRKRNAGTFLSAGLIKAKEHKLKYSTVIISTDGYLAPSDIDEFIKTKKKLIFLISSNGSDEVFKKYKNSNFISIKLPKN